MALTENFCGFFSNRPPIVVFMICLASFAVSLMTFAYIVKSRELPDPDVSEVNDVFFFSICSANLTLFLILFLGVYLKCLFN